MDDDYANWIMEFESRATEEAGFNEDEPLDDDLMDELYDEGLSVDEALSEYHIRN